MPVLYLRLAEHPAIEDGLSVADAGEIHQPGIHPLAYHPQVRQLGDVTLDLVTREVTLKGELVELQPREFTLLAFLLRHAGRPVTKTMILEHVWDYSFDPQTNVVDVLVHRLRAKVDPDKTRIETRRGVGYIFRSSPMPKA